MICEKCGAQIEEGALNIRCPKCGQKQTAKSEEKKPMEKILIPK